MKASELIAGKIYVSCGSIYLLVRKRPRTNGSTLDWIGGNANAIRDDRTWSDETDFSYIHPLGEKP